MSPQKLSLLDAPLKGISLIEASAGTGKTFTIAALYLRLVLGHGCNPISPENILVVTFTKAATEELRGRIRNRLRQAYNAIQTQDESLDPFVFSLLKELDHTSALERLKDAVQIMDIAAIYTIHGFAQKVLSQYSVESHVDDEFELILDQQEIEMTAVNDVWRKFVYPLSEAELDIVLDAWGSPSVLLRDVSTLVRRDVEFKDSNIKNLQDIDVAHKRFKDAFDKFCQDWQDQGQAFFNAIYDNEYASKSFTNHLSRRKQHLDDFTSGAYVKDIEKYIGYFTESGIKKSVTKKGEPTDHEMILSFTKMHAALLQWQEQKQQATLLWKIRFTEAIRTRLDELKQAQSVLCADDLLKQVLRSLGSSESLCTLLCQQFPMAMVDEFQDTDSTQYRVFSKLYSETPEETGFFMIGDPKQAIYKFRGADVFTYIQAKTEVEREFSLQDNYRSSPSLVSAVNALFQCHDRPFIFDDSIPFYPVGAASKSQLIQSRDIDNSACVFQTFDIDSDSGIEDIRTEVAHGVAEQVSVLLSSGLEQSTKVFDSDLDDYRDISSRDIAILVRSAHQARLVKQALDERGVAAVFKGQESLYNSAEALAVYELLNSLHSLSEQSYRNALANPVWMLSLDQLATHLQHEVCWEEELELMYECKRIWIKQGIMPMLMHWLHSRGLPQQWFALTDGERRITNYLHMAELLQEQASRLQGMQGLLTWFEHKLQNTYQSEEAQLRLESDENLVSIVTVHSSKGLEYPVVFLPYAWSMSKQVDVIYFDEITQSLCCDLEDVHKDVRLKEQLAEEVRLLYVGVTRASSQLYVTVPTHCDNKKINSTLLASPLFHVLCGSNENKVEAAPADQLANAISTLEKKSEQGVFAQQVLPYELTSFKAPDPEGDWQTTQFEGKIKQPWFMSSFSSLVRGLHVPHHQRFNFDEIDDDLIIPEVPLDKDILNPFTFPKGAHAGNFLHNLFEDIDFTRPMIDQVSTVQELLMRYGFEEKWLETVLEWSQKILHAPLQDQTLDKPISLSDLQPDQKSVEMEFYFPVNGLSCSKFNALLRKYPVLGTVQQVQDLDFDFLQGMLKGFIDLTFECQGRYYVLDYKSNFLGDELTHYHRNAMTQAMAEHRYDVQLVLYTLALHRLLKLTLPNYNYDEHMGGGFYLFLRGISGESQYGQFYHKPNRLLIEALDAMISGDNHD
ncbi:exodeoxyribonuclease V subunit beta [Bermanella marisrubri]|uniref:RecBCD enzyme subunit RecB n=1 Tax=Bermanella marisrubri TaxID=207949 RepID=Q1N2R0_9GAMM|nr:exodeoxyribonuclease V subunit beta [Bermanella marisrubri]EAT12609.1 exodeoxyribonuclease V beta chain [Oceanobacter sp. RED65] [Bermanella marisrubri]QIZ84838.1 exodeoxyribonuclease V subunit beta [Bermanella marisrubri]